MRITRENKLHLPAYLLAEQDQIFDVKLGFSKFESPFSVLHLNITSLGKNFEDFKELYKKLNLKFSIVCFSESWTDDNKLENDSLIQLSGYKVLHQIRKNSGVGG